MISTGLALGSTAVTVTVATALGIWYSRGRVRTVEELVSAPNTAGTAPLTASVVASALGTWVLFSPPEAAVAFGGIVGVLGYALGMAVPLAAFAVLGGRIRRLVPHGHSVTAYVLARYGRGMYALVLVVSGLYMFVFLAVELTGIAAALAIVADVPPALTASFVGLFVLAYTDYGGILASLVTDTLQALVMLPLLAVGFVGTLLALGGTGAVHSSVVSADSTLLSLTNPTGLRFGLYVGLALLGSTVLNQGLWQRVYAARDESTLRASFAVAAVAVVPVIFLAGLFGLGAVGLGVPLTTGHGAFFQVLLATEPSWFVLVVVVVAVLLVMSSADTLLSGLASLALHDAPRLVDWLEAGTEHREREELRAVRLLTGAVALAATAIGALQFSEIRLFLTADLLSAATFVPVVAGLYTGEIPEWGALLATVAGALAGLALDPALRWLVVLALPPSLAAPLPTPSFTVSFGLAVGVSLAVTAGSALVSGASTDLARLDERVRQLEGGERR